MTGAAPRPVRFADLGLRLASGLVLAAIALLDLWAGGAWAAGFLAVVLVLMLWEYHRMVTGSDALAAPGLVVPAVAGVVSLVATAIWGPPVGLPCLVVGAVLVALAGRPWSGWLTAGFVYMTAAMGALLVFRNREPEGVLLILWLVVVVVAADVGAYFVGRRVGGAKLWPAVSPGKTWSGAFGGLAAAGLVGIVLRLARGRLAPAPHRAPQPRDRGLLPVRRPARVGGEAAVRGEGREPADPRARRGDGPAGRGDGRRLVLRHRRQPRHRHLGLMAGIEMARRRISIFGSTGSVGQQTVELIDSEGGAETFQVVALTGAGNIELLARQAMRLEAEVAVTADADRLAELELALKPSGIAAAAGPEALLAAASEPVDWAMSAIVGAAGLAPGLRLARARGGAGARQQGEHGLRRGAA